MSEEKRLAVLIDSDNVSAKYAQFIMTEVQKYGVPTYKRVYGDWEKGGNGWHNPAINYSIMPVQQSSYIAGKNATDFSMIIDAMDILYTGNIDGFVLVTSDSDFTRLAIRLREAGKLVVGIGELKTPRAFTVSCHHFCYLNQIGEPEQAQDEQTIRKAVINFVTENQNERIDLAKISAVLTSKFGNINFDELGYKRFSSFIDSFPELRRSNTFVSLRKKKALPPHSAENPEIATEQSVTAAITEYFAEHQPERDNMLKLESYLTGRFGKIDFNKLGSSRFAKFIDKLPQFTRTGTFIRPADFKPEKALSGESFRQEVISYAAANMPDGGNFGQLNNHLMNLFGKDCFKVLGFEDFRSAVASVSEVKTDGNAVFLAAEAFVPGIKGLPKPDLSAVKARIIQYAAENMPDGGNVGQLNNDLIGAYGKGYVSELGFADFKSLMSSVPEIYVSKNRAYIAAKEEAAKQEQPVDLPQEKAVETPSKPQERTFEKPEINAVKREIIQLVASAENGVSLSAVGAALAERFGKDFLEQLGVDSMRKLTAELYGITLKNNKLYISEEFAQQTEEIERFVNDFARGEGSRSIRALGIELRKKFDGFDFHSYGFERFTDFINAIDGVKADRYHVLPVD